MTVHLHSLAVAPLDVGRRLVAEVELCIGALHRIEASVAPLIAGTGADLAGHALQDIDLVAQSLADIARCLEDLCDQLASLPPVEARRVLSRLRLDDLARRLAGQTAPGTRQDDRPADRIELF